MKSLSIYNNDFLSIKTSNDALEESIIRILLTSPGERVNNPLFGCGLKQSVFNFEDYLLEDIKIDIKRAITKWEPRATVLDISITNTEAYKYDIVLNVLNNTNNETFDITTILNT